MRSIGDWIPAHRAQQAFVVFQSIGCTQKRLVRQTDKHLTFQADLIGERPPFIWPWALA